MHSSFPSTSLISGIARVAVVTVLSSSVACVFAQQTGSAVTPLRTLDLSHPSQSLEASLKSPVDLAAAESSFSSSTSSAEAGLPSGATVASSDLQPPPRRRRYGRPNYSDKYRNADGSNRLAFNVGGGFNVPVGSASSDYLTTGYRFQGGIGINTSKRFGVMAQFDYDHFGIPDGVLQSQSALYNSVTSSTDFSILNGNAHIWSFTLNPTLNFYQGDSFGAYAVAGGGFYHKVTNFTIPTTGQYCDYIYGCYTYQTDEVIDHYTSNAPGVTGGVGLTYKLSRWGNERLFAEARFVHTFNQARLADPTLTGSQTGTFNNLYPPNSNETSYIPITFGIRF